MFDLVPKLLTDGLMLLLEVHGYMRRSLVLRESACQFQKRTILIIVPAQMMKPPEALAGVQRSKLYSTREYRGIPYPTKTPQAPHWSFP